MSLKPLGLNFSIDEKFTKIYAILRNFYSIALNKPRSNLKLHALFFFEERTSALFAVSSEKCQ